MPAINVPILTVWMFVAVVSLCSELFCKANTTEVTTTESYSTTDFSSGIGKKNLSLTVLINDNVTLNCSFDDYSERQKILWWFNDSVFFTESDSFLGNITNVGVDFNGSSSNMRIVNIQPYNAGKYRCALGSNETGLIMFLKITIPLKQIYLSVADSDVTDQEIKIMKDEEVEITCHAIGALPAANLSWRINGKLINYPFTYSSLENDEGTFDAVSTIRYRPKQEHEEVECVSTFAGSGEEKVARATLLINDKPIVQKMPFNLIWAMVSSGVGSLLITLNCICCLRRKCKAPRSPDSRTNSDESLDNFAPVLFTTTPDNISKEWECDNTLSRPSPSKLQLHRTVTTTEAECTYANYNSDKEELHLGDSEQPFYANYDEDPQKCKFPRVSVIPETLQDNEYEVDVKQLDFSKIPTTTEHPEDLEYEDLRY